MQVMGCCAVVCSRGADIVAVLLHERQLPKLDDLGELLPRTQPSPRLLMLLGRVRGYTATAVDGRRVAAMMRGVTTLYSFVTNDCLLR